MNEWDGRERRSSMFDKDFYDKMMETHTDIKYIRSWGESHDRLDIERFEAMDKRLRWAEKVLYCFIGVIGLFEFIARIIK